jgi:hypothetical protein
MSARCGALGAKLKRMLITTVLLAALGAAKTCRSPNLGMQAAALVVWTLATFVRHRAPCSAHPVHDMQGTCALSQAPAASAALSHPPRAQYFADVSQPYKTPVAGARGRATAFAVDADGARTPGRAPAAAAAAAAAANPRLASTASVRGILRTSSTVPRALAASGAAAAAAAAAAGTTANPAFRLAAVPAGGDTGVRPAARFGLPERGAPTRTADVPVRTLRWCRTQVRSCYLCRNFTHHVTMTMSIAWHWQARRQQQHEGATPPAMLQGFMGTCGARWRRDAERPQTARLAPQRCKRAAFTLTGLQINTETGFGCR